MVTEEPSLVQESRPGVNHRRTPQAEGDWSHGCSWSDTAGNVGTVDTGPCPAGFLGHIGTKWQRVCQSGHQPGPQLASLRVTTGPGPHSLNGRISRNQASHGYSWVAMPMPKHTILRSSCLDGDAGPGLRSWETTKDTGVECLHALYFVPFIRECCSQCLSSLAVFEMGWGEGGIPWLSSG